jgi:hypothetical protein
MGMARALESAADFRKIQRLGSDALLTVIHANGIAKRVLRSTKHRFRVAGLLH